MISDQTLADIREFVRTRVAALEPEMLQGPDLDSFEPVQALRREVKSRGWWAPNLGHELGGMGLTLQEFAPVSEAMGWSPLGHYVFGAQAPDAGNAEVLHEFGSDEQKERWLMPVARGDARSCFGMTEPENAGSNPKTLSSTARIDDGEWVINAHKWFTTGADGAAFCVVMVVTDPDSSSPYGKASMILVPTDAPGYEIVRNISVMGEPGCGWASHSEVKLTDVRVPEANLLGGRGMGFLIAQQRLGPGRIHHCMRWLGLAERAFFLMCERAATRDIGGGKMLGSRQVIQTWIAESRTEIDAARLLTLDAARQIDELGTHGARNAISAIKFFVAGILQKVVDRSIQVHGALGMTDDTILAWIFRHERAARIYDGPDEVHKMVVARRILREHGM
ncbi:MAG: alkylation response protein AidB-like acyl-CoA dehydrogenase [Bradymonadia bacterium]|jgi:alkylation response protein AidB-like acyl-CoA dehydrogenase